MVADDERPARAFLVSLLRSYDDVEIVGEASSGAEAVGLIERVTPDLALLDLQMPEVDGLGVVQLVRKDRLPLVAFVTAYDEYAVKAFELNAVDYLLKPVEPARLRQTINRALERLEQADLVATTSERVRRAAVTHAASAPAAPLHRIPVRQRDDIVLVPVEQVSSLVADGELIRLTTLKRERHVISHRLKDIEARLDPARFVRLSRGALVNVDAIRSITPVAGGTYAVTLHTGETLGVSRIRARVLREQLLKL